MNQLYKIILLCVFMLGFCGLLALDSEDLTKIKSIKNVIDSGNRYLLYPAELFDGDVPWKIVRGSSFLETASFVTKTPNSESFKIESEMYYKEKVNPKSLKSIQIHSNIEIPGRDKVFIKPEISKSIPVGIPVRLFFWVYSNNYDINLKVLLSHKKNQDIIIDFGVLKFNGWKRMDAKVTIYKPQGRLNLSRFNQFELKGILLESLKTQLTGSFYIFVDQMGILIEKPEIYPGSEVPDGWELY